LQDAAVVRANNLYTAIKNVSLVGNQMKLDDGFRYPVEPLEASRGLQFVRQAHIDLWKLFVDNIDKPYECMLILGPSGIGKS
jgi:hypothetical protein